MGDTLNRRDFSSLLATSVGLGLGFILRPERGDAIPPKTMPFQLGIITDEITEKLDDALDFIASYSLPGCELRDMWGKNIMNSPQADLDRAKALIAQHHLKVSDIASPIMKYNLPEMPARPEHRDTFRANFTEEDTENLLHESFKLAEFFGTNKVRVFAYSRVDDPEKAYPYVRDRLAKAAALAGQNGIVLVLENEHTCNVGTGKELGRILRDVNLPSLRGNWDAGNAAMLGEVPYPDGYREVRGLIGHTHVKDVSARRRRVHRLARADQGADRRWLPRDDVARNALPPSRRQQTGEHARVAGGLAEDHPCECRVKEVASNGRWPA